MLNFRRLVKLNLKNIFLSIGIAAVASIIFFIGQKTDITASAKTAVELQQEVEKYIKLIAEAQKQAESLSREINIISNNISLKTVQIQQAEAQITQKENELALLKEDIRLMEIRLDRLAETISGHINRLGSRIRSQYIESQSSPMEVLVSSENMSDFVARMKYLELIEAEDKELINRMNKTKSTYEEQKELLRKKKDEVEAIKKEIEKQKALAESLKQTLEQQKAERKNLLEVTKSDEKKYQQAMEEAKKELAQIQSAANVVIREGKGVDVKKGEKIGTMGSSGFSTGAHLHFGVYKYTVDDFEEHPSWSWYYDNSIEPKKVLKSKTVKWGTGCYRDPGGDSKYGEGDWDWPMDEVRITQNYGTKTCYNWMYRGRIHPALDMVVMGDITVKAINDGKAYFCRNCLNDGGNGVFIFHEDGKMSLYWHLK